MSQTFLKSLSDKLATWDTELSQLKGRAGEMAGDKKEQFQKISEEVKQSAAELKGKLDEYRGKSPEELKADAEELLRGASGKVADGLKKLSAFFESKAGGPSA